MLQLVFALVILSACLSFPLQTRADETSLCQLQEQFRTDNQWAGADGAYSIDMKNGKSIWLFGDTFIGTITDGTRKDNQMIHNSVAVQDLKSGNLSFAWIRGEKPGSYFSEGNNYWLWPGDGVYHNGKIYFFARRISLKQGKEDDPFGFVWQADELIVIDNPEENPSVWQMRHLLLPFTNKEIHLGCACLISDGRLYVLGLNEKKHSAFMARIALEKLQDLDHRAFEFMSSQNPKPSWRRTPGAAISLWTKAASEGSFCAVRSGFLSIYNENSMGLKIVCRTAASIEGPWSKQETVLYEIPQAQSKRGFCYAAKVHPELSPGAQNLVLSYAINPGTIEAHARDPYAYFPHFVLVKTPDLSKKDKTGHN